MSNYLREKIGRQKLVAQMLKNILQKRFETSDIVIMGGAPRDWHMGIPSTDIDIFIYKTMKKKNIKDIFEKISSTFGFCEFRELEKNKNYDGNPNISTVWETGLYDEKVQVIFCNIEPLELMRLFPINISMIYWDNGMFFKSNAYMLGKKEKVLIKMNRDTYTNERYIKKIKEKFPAFRYYESQEEFFKEGVSSYMQDDEVDDNWDA